MSENKKEFPRKFPRNFFSIKKIMLLSRFELPNFNCTCELHLAFLTLKIEFSKDNFGTNFSIFSSYSGYFVWTNKAAVVVNTTPLISLH